MTMQKFYNQVRFKYGSYFRALVALRPNLTEAISINHKLTIRRLF